MAFVDVEYGMEGASKVFHKTVDISVSEGGSVTYTDIPFEPDIVIVKTNSSNTSVRYLKDKVMTNTGGIYYTNGASGWSNNYIQSITSNGFVINNASGSGWTKMTKIFAVKFD